MSFILHPTLKNDCIDLGRLSLCRLLLMNDQQFPWLILVPERNNISEIYQLSEADQHQLICESSYISEHLSSCFQADKINIAALGNSVAQLHIHHVVRYTTDKAWPLPIWGKFDALAYNEQQLQSQCTKINTFLNNFKLKINIL